GAYTVPSAGTIAAPVPSTPDANVSSETSLSGTNFPSIGLSTVRRVIADAGLVADTAVSVFSVGAALLSGSRKPRIIVRTKDTTTAIRQVSAMYRIEIGRSASMYWMVVTKPGQA